MISTNVEEIEFEDEEYNSEIPVNKESKSLICIANASKWNIKIQITSSMNDKRDIRIEPDVVILKRGEGCEFSIYIKPICTCSNDNDQLAIIYQILNSNNSKSSGQSEIRMKYKTTVTTRLDPDELIEEKKLGEGSFGVVYKGTFRGHEVAIKKLKESNDTEERRDEFEKEVAMLDKFRCDFIVHFYGAVFIPNKICMVTEFAPFGSLSDLIQHHKPIDENIRIKILLDASKGISYLHNNGILHRDIKPDNILVFDIEHKDNSFINGKLTDFGSARNINMLMTNMTFSKGIGTPVYMAPEILNQAHYKSPADIYSFSITMFEVMKWGESYEGEAFKFTWKIAEFVCQGKRLEKPLEMNANIYEIITQCWQQEPKVRLTIDEVSSSLEILIN